METLERYKLYIIFVLIVGILFLAVMLLVFTDLKNAFWPGIEPVIRG